MNATGTDPRSPQFTSNDWLLELAPWTTSIEVLADESENAGAASTSSRVVVSPDERQSQVVIACLACFDRERSGVGACLWRSFRC